MSKRDFEALAILISEYSYMTSNPAYLIAGGMADYFEKTYPHFNKDKFLNACGVPRV